VVAGVIAFGFGPPSLRHKALAMMSKQALFTFIDLVRQATMGSKNAELLILLKAVSLAD
jgi:hypothetical protein